MQVIKTEEKGSDVNLTCYLLLDAFRRDFETAVVVSNDSDLKEPMAIVQPEMSLPIGVVNPHPAGRRSRAFQPDFFKQLREKDLVRSQFPAILRDGHGTIRKPAGW